MAGLWVLRNRATCRNRASRTMPGSLPRTWRKVTTMPATVPRASRPTNQREGAGSSRQTRSAWMASRPGARVASQEGRYGRWGSRVAAPAASSHRDWAWVRGRLGRAMKGLQSVQRQGFQTGAGVTGTHVAGDQVARQAQGVAQIETGGLADPGGQAREAGLGIEAGGQGGPDEGDLAPVAADEFLDHQRTFPGVDFPRDVAQRVGGRMGTQAVEVLMPKTSQDLPGVQGRSDRQGRWIILRRGVHQGVLAWRNDAPGADEAQGIDRFQGHPAQG